MGIIDKIFKSQRDIAKEEIEGLPWETLDSIDQLDNVIKNSNKKTKIIFKHSTRCGISRMVLKTFENGYSLKNPNANFYLLDLLNNRDVSNAIEDKLNIVHQSPQVIVLKDELVQHTESHQGIDIHKVETLIQTNA